MILFELMIVNNWLNNVDVHVLYFGTKNCRFFFVIWNIIGVVLFCNILIANIIDYLVWSWELTNTEEEENKKKELENSRKEDNYSFS